MTWRTIALVVAGAAALACFVIAWVAHARHDALQLERWARTINIKRQDGESRRNFRRRVLDRASAFYRRAP